MASCLSKQHQVQQYQRLSAAGWAAWRSLLEGLKCLEVTVNQPGTAAGLGPLHASLSSKCSISSCQTAVQQHHWNTQFPLQQQGSQQLQHRNLFQHSFRVPTLQNPSTPSALQVFAHTPPYISQFLQQQQRHYHPAQHKARTLTVKLQQKQQWQDLQMMFDSSGSGRALNAIHLSTMLLQLSRVAPAPELVPANERQQLKQFMAELVSSCHQKLHRMDHRALASFTQSLVALEYDVHQQPPAAPAAATVPTADQQQLSATYRSSSTSSTSSGGTNSSLFDDILRTGIKRLPLAGAQSCSVLTSAVATLLQQQQQQAGQGQHPQQQQQQQQLLQELVQALTTRIHSLTATGCLTIVEACKLCLAAGRLAAVIRAITPPAAAAVVGSAAASVAGASDMTRKLKPLLILATQQLAAAMTTLAAEAAEAGIQNPEQWVTMEEVGLLLYCLAKSKVWPGWDTLLLLLQQYSAGVDATLVAAAQNYTNSGSSRRRAASAAAAAAAAAAAMDHQQGHSAVDGVVKCLPSAVWAIGRLLGQQQQQQIQQQLQHHIDVGRALDSCLVAAGTVIDSLSPAQLAQLAAGLSNVVDAGWTVLRDAEALLQGNNNQPGVITQQQQQQQQQEGETELSSALPQEAPPPTPPTPPTPAAAAAGAGGDLQVSASSELQQACDQLQQQLKSPVVQGFLKQHMSRVEGLLPLMPVDVRLQLANSYRQLDVQLPRSLSVAFERDAAAAAAAASRSNRQAAYWHV